MGITGEAGTGPVRSRVGAAEGRVDVPALYASHWLSTVRLAVLLVGDTLVAEDVAQEAFVALYRQQHRLRDPQAAVGYLRASVVNLARSVLRRRTVARRHSRHSAPVPATPPEEFAMAAEEYREVMTALEALPERQREVLILQYWGEVPQAEIATILGISPGAVRSTASRGLASLRSVMTGGEVR